MPPKQPSNAEIMDVLIKIQATQVEIQETQADWDKVWRGDGTPDNPGVVSIVADNRHAIRNIRRGVWIAFTAAVGSVVTAAVAFFGGSGNGQ